MNLLRSFFRKYIFFVLLVIFSIAFPYLVVDFPFGAGMLATFLIFSTLHRISYYLFALFFLVALGTVIIVLPQVMFFGDMGAMIITPIFETDLSEAQEFARSLPFYAYLIPFLFFLFGVWILYLGKKFVYAKESKTITLLLFLSAFLLTIHRPAKQYIFENQPFDMIESRVSIITFYISVYEQIQAYKHNKEEFSKEITQKPTWDIIASSPQYKNYVLVIGESVRRDYMSLYGFEIENSSFLKNAKGTILEGFTSTASNTVASLTRTLIQLHGDDFLYANNIISLAKEAGFRTYWISNQDYSNATLSKIALLTDQNKFTKFRHASLNYYDSVLLPVFDNFLQEVSDTPRLFVLHLEGSHPFFKKRLEKPIHYDYVNSNLSAYLQTIEQTDDFLRQIYQKLQQSGQTFSLLYFADHGLVTRDRDIPWLTTLLHGANTKAAYSVPFALLSSNDTLHHHIKVEKTAFRFLDGFANWLGIKEKSLQKEYSFLSPMSDSLEVFIDNRRVPFHSLEKDPPVMKNSK